MSPTAQGWNPELYQSSHSFVWKFGQNLLAELAPQPDERILDVGCGTGQLTAEISRAGAEVLGIDLAASMVEKARHNFPALHFEQLNVTALPYREEFDAVFSNATLHWVLDPEAAAQAISRALKPGGRFVAEFGGHGNLEVLLDALYPELRALGVSDPQSLSPWYYPSIGEYATVLERAGLEVASAALFDRPTPLEGGDQALENWLAMFGTCFTGALAPELRAPFLRRVEARAADRLRVDGTWTIDYRRLRIRAIKRR